MDVGAGNFTWGHYIAQYIDTLHTENRIPEDVHVHIINVRGEQNHANLHENGDGRLTWIKTDSYTMYNFGCFKIEELENELHQYDISQKFDLVVSRWTLRHLVDPTGTFVQILNSLNPDGGIFLADGFFLDYTDSKFDEEFNEERNMALLLVNSRIPFLIYPYSCGRSMNQFIVQRPSDGQLQVPLLYHNMRSIGSNYQCNSQRVTEFEKSSEWKDFLNDAIKYKYSLYDNVKNKFKKSYYFGTITSKSLFDWLIEHKLIYPRDSN